jgi:hypothetical protein
MRGFSGGVRGTGTELGMVFSSNVTVTTCSPQPAHAGIGASSTPARRTRAVPSDDGEQGQCKSALMIVQEFESIRVHSGD